MKYKKAKFFWKKSEVAKEISCLDYCEEDIEYYTFVKKCHDQGYRQIIITSELMVDLLEYFFFKENLLVYQIDLAEEDEELEEEIDVLINNSEKDGKYFYLLAKTLNFLSEKSSIDIQLVYMKGRNSEGVIVDLFLQSNGIVGINVESFSKISDNIKNIIERYLLK